MSPWTVVEVEDLPRLRGWPGLTAPVADDSTTTFHAVAIDGAGNRSDCSSSFATYVEDSTAPAAPTMRATDPASGANDNSPRVSGSAAAGSTVRLYTGASCTGAVAATGPAAVFASPGLTASVADDSSTAFRATATDAAGNASACSPTSVTYVERSATTPPPGPPPPPVAPPPPPPPPPGAPRDTTAPIATLSGPLSQKLGPTVRVIAACPVDACKVALAGSVRVPKVAAASAKTYALGKLTTSIAAGRKATLKARLAPAARRAIAAALRRKRPVSVSVTVTATDAAGNARTLKRTIRFKLR